MGNWVNLLPVFCFLMFMLGVSFYIQYASRKERSTNFARSILNVKTYYQSAGDGGKYGFR